MKKRSIPFMCSMHCDSKIVTLSDKQKPEIITYYNSNKSGVDTVEELCGTYPVSRKCTRCLFTRFFFGMMNEASISAYIAYCLNNEVKKKLNRQDFLRELYMELVKEHLPARTNIPLLFKELRNGISRLAVIHKMRKARNVPKRTQ